MANLKPKPRPKKVLIEKLKELGKKSIKAAARGDYAKVDKLFRRHMQTVIELQARLTKDRNN